MEPRTTRIKLSGKLSDADPNQEGAGGQPWFALRVKSRFEKVVALAARNKGFKEFLPLCRTQHAWSDRLQSVDVPLFPGYVFCRLNPENRFPLLTIPGVMHFVGMGKTPVAVDHSEIAAIQCAVQSELKVEPWPFVEVGNRVKLHDGPLAGLEGFLVQVRTQDRVIVSVSLLRRSVAVEIDSQWIKPVRRRATKTVASAQ